LAIAAVAGLTAALHGAPPPIMLVSVAAASFDHHDGLSPAVERALPAVVEAVAAVVAGRRLV
jgi:Ni,Fe-hydrogenase maturation factor